MMTFGFSDKIPDPKRPGPDYYSDCIKFHWADALVEKHKKHLVASNGENVYEIEYTPEELAIMQKLKEKAGAKKLIAIGLTSMLALISVI